MALPSIRIRTPRTDVAKLQGLAAAEISALRTSGIETVEELEARVAREGFSSTVPDGGVSARALFDALVQHVLLEAAGKTYPFPRRALAFLRTKWMDVLLLALAGGIAAGILHAAGRPERVVVAVRDLAPFRMIGPEDVEERRTEAEFGAFTSAEAVVGHFPLHFVPAEKPLLKDRLSRVRFAGPHEMDGRRILSLPVSAQSLPLAVPGTRVALLLSPRTPPDSAAAAPVVVNDVMVLNALGAGDTAAVVVAVPEAALAALAPSLGSFQAFVLGHVRPTRSIPAGDPAAPPRR